MKESKRGVYGRFWREEREGGNDIIVIAISFLKSSKP